MKIKLNNQEVESDKVIGLKQSLMTNGLTSLKDVVLTFDDGTKISCNGLNGAKALGELNRAGVFFADGKRVEYD